MGDLILNSLEIQNFRGFQHLQIERLGRVNLIVGKNNVGKSALLEALRLYAVKHPSLIWDLLYARDESELRPSRIRPLRGGDIKQLLTSLKYLFYGRKSITPDLESIKIGPVGSLQDTLSIRIDWYRSVVEEEDGRLRQQLLLPDEYYTADDAIPRFTVQIGEHKTSYPLRASTSALSGPRVSEFKEISCVFIDTNGISSTQIAALWDGITLNPAEEDILGALRIIAPGVAGLSVIGAEDALRERIPVIKVAGVKDRLPLRSLGTGMQRLLGIALALVNARDGLLLVDEVENGLHYSVQFDLWRFIFQLARRFNVQVFAATHSWDCIEGFSRAALEDPQEGLLLRLQSRNSKINAVLYNEEELSLATRDEIEVR